MQREINHLFPVDYLHSVGLSISTQAAGNREFFTLEWVQSLRSQKSPSESLEQEWLEPGSDFLYYLWLFIPYPTRRPALNQHENRTQMEGKTDSVYHSFNPPQRFWCLYTTRFLSIQEHAFFRYSILYFTFFVPVGNKITTCLHLKQS